MNASMIAVLLAGISTAAVGAELPVPASQDGLVCTRVYNADQVTVIHMQRDRELTVELAPTEKIKKVTASDVAHLMFSTMKDSHVAWFMPLTPLPPQPVTVISEREDGSLRTYLMQVDAGNPEDVPRAAVAQNATLGGPVIPDGPPKPCYMVRYTYPADEQAAKAAKAAAAGRAWVAQRDAARDAALLRQTSAANANIHYVAIGDRNLAPDRIFDDGNSTFLEYDGNRSIPAPYGIGRDGKDKLLVGFTSEEGTCPGGAAVSATCLKLHTVAAKFRLRDQEDLAGVAPSLEIFNRAYNPIGNRPGTGTTSPSVQREVR